MSCRRRSLFLLSPSFLITVPLWLISFVWVPLEEVSGFCFLATSGYLSSVVRGYFLSAALFVGLPFLEIIPLNCSYTQVLCSTNLLLVVCVIPTWLKPHFQEFCKSLNPQMFSEAVGVQLVLRGCRMHRRETLISAKHRSHETLKGNQFNDFEFCRKKKRKIIAVFSNDGWILSQPFKYRSQSVPGSFIRDAAHPFGQDEWLVLQ